MTLMLAVRARSGKRSSTASSTSLIYGLACTPVCGRAQLSAARLAVAPCDLVPGDDVPPGRQIVRTTVLVAEVVGVLPDVDAEKRRVSLGERRVLVGGRVRLERRAVPDEPAPAAAEPGDAVLGHRLLQRVEAAEGVVDRAAQVAARLAAAGGAHYRPEERMVRMPTGVVAHGALLVCGKGGQVAQDVLDGPVGPLRALEGLVRIVLVRLVVLVVVDPHRLGVDVRLERLVRVGQVGNGVRHRSLLLVRFQVRGQGYAAARPADPGGARCRSTRRSSRVS